MRRRAGWEPRVSRAKRRSLFFWASPTFGWLCPGFLRLAVPRSLTSLVVAAVIFFGSSESLNREARSLAHLRSRPTCLASLAGRIRCSRAAHPRYCFWGPGVLVLANFFCRGGAAA